MASDADQAFIAAVFFRNGGGRHAISSPAVPCAKLWIGDASRT